MVAYTDSIEKLIECLIKFPGVGKRSAERMISYVLNASPDEIRLLSEALVRVKENVHLCRICNNLSEEDLCKICQDTRRRHDTICVVEKASDVTVLEKAGAFDGGYHVLMGSISPLDGKGPGDLKIDGLLDRIKKDTIKEIIIATDADTEGETTALYLTKVLKPFGVHMTRIGLGLPAGSNLEYADPVTLTKSIEARRTL
ncbi:MAG TPA: recombination mediator RecR [Candidatus Omnitrophota bacterium]|nr:recombination mediator RecR [Candidatus Omnitrophota bacterium]HPT06932.1 recombination mediator RecR [Candidatus Omnitrophota bacterium]